MPAADYEPGWALTALERDWATISQDAINRAAFNMKRAADSFTIRQPIKWSTGNGDHLWMDAAENYGMPTRIVLGIDPATFNERSKPVGLTNEHKYSDSTDRTLLIEGSADDERAPYIHVKDGSHGVGIWLNYADTIPLALNVLGYDRPKPADFTLTSAVVVKGDGHRDDILAHAVASLRAIDLYDQWAEKRKADEEAAAAAARAEVAKREIAERFLRKAKEAYAEAITSQLLHGINAESTAAAQSALSSYETARRKVEGLPN